MHLLEKEAKELKMVTFSKVMEGFAWHTCKHYLGAEADTLMLLVSGWGQLDLEKTAHVQPAHRFWNMSHCDSEHSGLRTSILLLLQG